MLNFFTKTSPIILATVIATSAFAQDNAASRPVKKCFEQGLEMPMNQTMSAHSYPARTEVRGSWDIWAKGSFLYWQALQDNMDIGLVSSSPTPLTTIGSTSTVAHANDKYKMGFKVGLGVNLSHDNWETLAEYTWFHGETNTFVDAGDQTLFPMQGYPVGTDFLTANQSWDLKMDFADLSLGRGYYSGTKLILTPFFGARGALIRQHLYTAYDGADTLTIADRTISQGIGPRTGLNGKWCLGYGFKLTGDASGDILYTRYNYQTTQTAAPLLGATTSEFSVEEKRNDFLRAHAALELGLGWGSYFDNHNWHVDLSASYGFQVFWDQNMVRSYNGAGLSYSSVPNGNLYIHGLTANLKLDF
jgi:hypothetical protein